MHQFFDRARVVRISSSLRDRRTAASLCLLSLMFVMGCPDTSIEPPAGLVGDGPIADGIAARLGDPLPSATAEEVAVFERGRAVAVRRFDLSDGLGPEFNVTFCGACHERPVFGGSSGLYRNFFLSGTVSPAGVFDPGEFGGIVRKNSYGRESLFPSVRDDGAVFAQRNAIPFFGMGLIAELSEAEILSRADVDDADGDGISGRPNFERGFVGRFGRKAQTTSIEGFVRGPMNNHLGITSNPLNAVQRSQLPRGRLAGMCPLNAGDTKPVVALQAVAADGPLTDDDSVADPELSGDDLFDLVRFVMLLAAPMPEPLTERSERGRLSFHAVGCADCHVPRLDGPRGPVHAYSDFLLHDMGASLADGIQQGVATGSEFRTQPLWGIAAVGPYLHDGRGETLEGAILAHAGEASASRDRFAGLASSERGDLIEFLLTLGGRDQSSTGLVPPGEPVADVGEYGGPVRALSADEASRFLIGRELFDREFGFETGIGALTGSDGRARFNGDSCRACHFDPVIGGSGPRGVNVMRHGAVDAGGLFSAPATTANTILHTQTRNPSEPNRPEDGINVFEPRQTPHVLGAGLVDAISDETILAGADENDEDGDGVSGRAHVIENGAGVRVGRFGWKAQVPSVAEFIRDAMAAELGLSVETQAGLTFGVSEDDDGVADPEFSAAQAEDLAFFMGMLAGPPRQSGASDAASIRGEAVFSEVGCDKCHTPSLPASFDGETVDVPLYSNLLLHAVIDDGTPGIDDGSATGVEFRTAPLWGLSQTAPYFHNGSADTIDEAIRLHGAEATGIRQAYEALADADRADLLAFLDTL